MVSALLWFFILTLLAEGGINPANHHCTTCLGAAVWAAPPLQGTMLAGFRHWYWIVYDIPADVTSLAENSTGIGTLGNNSVNGNIGYAPPCSQGPGEKIYIFTVYALSAQPQFSVPASDVDRDVLLEAIRDITLASAELHVSYTRR